MNVHVTAWYGCFHKCGQLCTNESACHLVSCQNVLLCLTVLYKYSTISFNHIITGEEGASD